MVIGTPPSLFFFDAFQATFSDLFLVYADGREYGLGCCDESCMGWNASLPQVNEDDKGGGRGMRGAGGETKDDTSDVRLRGL